MAVQKVFGQQTNFRWIPTTNFVVESSASAPSSPVNGQLWHDTTNNLLMVRLNGAWVNCGNTGVELLANKGAVNGYASLDGSTKVPIAQIPTGSTGSTVPFGNDARFSDQRVPADGSVTGGTAGAGVKIAATTITAANIANATITDTQVATANKDGIAATASLRTLGTGSQQATAGNDARLSDQRVPTDGSVTGGTAGAGVKIAAGTITDANVNAANKDGVVGLASLRTLGNGAQQAMPGNYRLDQITAPTASVSMNSQRLTSLAPSAAATDAVNRAELDAAMQGITGVKTPVRAASVDSLFAGVNVNLASPGTTIGNVTMASGERFLAPSQSTGTQNGIYVWNGSAVPATRDLDTDAAGEVRDGTTVAVAEGYAQNLVFMQQATPSGAPGAWTQAWTIFNTGGITYTNGNGLNLSANQFSVKKDTVDATNPIAVSANGVGLGTVPIDHGGTGQVTAAAAIVALGGMRRYTALLGAITAGVEVSVTHSLNTLFPLEPSFIVAADSSYIDFGSRVIDANTVGVTAGETYLASAIRVVVMG